MNKIVKILIPIFIIISIFSSCEEIYTPRPKGYHRVTFPPKVYQKLDSIFPYKFAYPLYAKIENDRQKDSEKYWINVYYPTFKARVHLTYRDISNNLNILEEDTRNLAYKHTIKADAINEKVWNNPEKKVYGILYEIKGNAASSIQFYLTDSTKHFLRGALYFNVHPNKDSINPSLNFIRKDIDKMIETFEWKEGLN